MSAHTHTVITPGCYRCELNADEMEAAEQELAVDAQEAWLTYRDEHARRRALNARQVGHQLRRRDFIAGYMEASR